MNAYSHTRLKKVIGNIAGTQLGFNQNPDGGIKPLPETSAEIVLIKKIYPLRRCVDFCFLGSDNLYPAAALLDHWYREGLDTFQPPSNFEDEGEERSWPFITPESNSVDLLTQISLLGMIYPPFKSLLPIIKQLIESMGGQHNVIKLLRVLASQDSLNLSMFFQLVGLKASDLEDLARIDKLKDLVKTPEIPSKGKLKELVNIPSTGDAEVPLEPLYGAVIPLKGDKKQGYLLLGFIKQ